LRSERKLEQVREPGLELRSERAQVWAPGLERKTELEAARGRSGFGPAAA
jgi:hypothetical protein